MKGVISNIVGKAQHLAALIIFVSGFILGSTATTTLTPKVTTPTSITTYMLTTTFFLEHTTTTTTTITKTVTVTTAIPATSHPSTVVVTVTKTVAAKTKTVALPKIVSLHYNSTSANADIAYRMIANETGTLVHAELLVNIFGVALVELKASMAINETTVLTLLRFQYSLPIPFTPPKAYNVTIYLLKGEKVLGIAKGIVEIDVERGSGVGILPITWVNGKPELSNVDRISISFSPQKK